MVVSVNHNVKTWTVYCPNGRIGLMIIAHEVRVYSVEFIADVSCNCKRCKLYYCTGLIQFISTENLPMVIISYKRYPFHRVSEWNYFKDYFWKSMFQTYAGKMSTYFIFLLILHNFITNGSPWKIYVYF